ncbi:rhomboid-domain-containing protein, partial [Backusella circina FSU 941]
GKVIQVSPFNIMVGPSAETLIHMGARYTPCMKSTLIYSSTQNIYVCPTNNRRCSLDELCGGTHFEKPNQGYRFVTSLVMHSGTIQLIINLTIHIRVGMIVERIIHPIRYGILWCMSGIIGSIFGALFSPQGNVISGCSACLVGIVGYLLIDTIFNWHHIKMRNETLIFLLLCFAFSLFVGLLPGYDNFSHIGGLLGGLTIAICLLPFSHHTLPMKSRYQAWLIGSMSCLFLTVLLWFCLRLFFAPDASYCDWCKYFACLPIADVCRPYFTQFT